MPTLSVVISALNEEQNVPTLFQRLLATIDKDKIDAEIVFLNNHSQDKTGPLADAIAKKDKRVRVIHRYNRENKDLGSSLREGLSQARGTYVIIMDADLSHDPETIKDLLAHRKEADIIIGSRYVHGGGGDMAFSRAVISRTYNLTVRLLLGVRVHDITTGFKLYRREVIQSLHLTNNGFGLHVEIILKAVRKGYTTKEVPIYYRARTGGRSKLNYRRQFKAYAIPVLGVLKERFFGE